MTIKARGAKGPDLGGWHANPRFVAGLDSELLGWLREPQSLTARLRGYGATTVERLRELPRRPHRDELWIPGVSPHSRVVTREVVLRVDGVPWVFAHTVVNPSGIRLLRRAGRRALAVVLFADPKVQAGALHYRAVDQRHPLFRAARAWCGDSASMRLPARRAVFRRGRAWLLVTEVFLPPVSR